MPDYLLRYFESNQEAELLLREEVLISHSFCFTMSAIQFQTKSLGALYPLSPFFFIKNSLFSVIL